MHTPNRVYARLVHRSCTIHRSHASLTTTPLAHDEVDPLDRRPLFTVNLHKQWFTNSLIVIFCNPSVNFSSVVSSLRSIAPTACPERLL